MDWIWNVDIAIVVEAAAAIALAIAAATPTEKDDGIVGRIANLARIITPFLARKG